MSKSMLGACVGGLLLQWGAGVLARIPPPARVSGVEFLNSVEMGFSFRFSLGS